MLLLIWKGNEKYRQTDGARERDSGRHEDRQTERDVHGKWGRNYLRAYNMMYDECECFLLFCFLKELTGELSMKVCFCFKYFNEARAFVLFLFVLLEPVHHAQIKMNESCSFPHTYSHTYTTHTENICRWNDRIKVTISSALTFTTA
jgi:hypothetical protein